MDTIKDFWRERHRTTRLPAGFAAALGLILLVVAGLHRPLEPAVVAATGPTAATSATASKDEAQGFLYGRVTTADGTAYQGRLRFGRDEEAFWGDYFNGSKLDNPWAAYVPDGQPRDPRPMRILGFELPFWGRPAHLSRPFMARFGDIVRIEALGRRVRVTLKSGIQFTLDRMAASDFDDGVRLWDDTGAVVDLVSWTGGIPPASHVRIRTIDLLPTARLGSVPTRLHGTVQTRGGLFSGFVQWDRQYCVGLDALNGRTADGPISLRFDTIRSIARRSGDSALVTLLDGRALVLSGTRAVGRENRGLYVDDARYGRVLVSWDAFDRVDFSNGGSGPAYTEFAPGGPIVGSVTVRGGRRLEGRIVYDLDESEITETLDAPHQGIDYTLPFGLIASIAPVGPAARGGQGARVTLHGGEDLRLEATGDLAPGNAGLLVFVEGRERPEHVTWTDIERVDFRRPPAMYPASAAGARPVFPE